MQANIYLKTNNIWISLKIAAGNVHLNLCKALVDKHYFDVHLKNDDGWTALHHSVRSGNYDLVDYFASMVADVYINTNEGSNCLHISARFEHLDLCRRLIYKHKCDVYKANSYRWTAVHESA